MDTTVKIKQNLDTNFIKLVAVISMFIDHFSKEFFPDNVFFAMIGRIAFPLFAYCIVVGCLYTHDIKKYMIRLTVFGVISQPLFNLAFHPSLQQFIQEFFSLNIFFTLLAGVLAVAACMNFRKHWWMLVIAVAMEFFIGLDYGFNAIILMMVFYFCRKNSILSFILVTFLIGWGWGFRGDFITIAGIGLDRQVFSVLALPFIYIHTNFHPKINKYFFYIFYPAHLLLLFIVKMLF